MKPYVRVLLAWAVLFFMPHQALSSQEGNPATAMEEAGLFQEIPSVYTASKYVQALSDAPSSVSIITSEEIRRYGYRTLAGILRSQRGFYVSYDRSYHFVGIRGFSRPSDYNTRILLLVDGVRLNDAVYDSASLGTEFILDVDLIDRVEIVRGPGSSLYGSNALFGVVNVITRSGRSLQGFEVSAEAGSLETYKGRLTYGNRFANGMEALFSGSWYTSEGDDRLYFPEYDDGGPGGGIFEDGDDEQALNLLGKISLGDFTLEGAYVGREKRLPTGAYETEFNDSRTFTRDEEYFVDLKYERRYESGWNALARIYYAAYPYGGDYVYDYAEDEDEEPFIVLNRDESDARWFGVESHVSRRIAQSHHVTFGAEYRRNIRQDQKNFDLEVYMDDRRDSDYWALFLQDEWRIGERLLANAGVRFDSFENFDDKVSPRFALIFTPRPATSLKLLYGEAFRNPNAYERFYQDGGFTQKASTGLDGESIETYEVVLEHQFGPHFTATAAGFINYMDNLITLVTDPEDDLLVFENVENIESKGVELELEARLENGIGGRLSYTYQDAEDRDIGAWLTNSPRHLASLNLTAPLLTDLLAGGVELLYMSERLSKSGAEISGHFLAGATLTSELLSKRLIVAASVYNLFDESFSDPASEEHLQDKLEQDGRTFRLKVTYAF